MYSQDAHHLYSSVLRKPVPCFAMLLWHSAKPAGLGVNTWLKQAPIGWPGAWWMMTQSDCLAKELKPFSKECFLTWIQGGQISWTTAVYYCNCTLSVHKTLLSRVQCNHFEWGKKKRPVWGAMCLDCLLTFVPWLEKERRNDSDAIGSYFCCMSGLEKKK